MYNVYNLIFELLAKGNVIIRRNMAAEHRGFWSPYAPDDTGEGRFGFASDNMIFQNLGEDNKIMNKEIIL